MLLMDTPQRSSAPAKLPHGHVRPFTRLTALLAAEKTDLLVALTYSVVIGLLSLVVPVAIQSLVNTIAFGTLVQPLVVLTILVLAALGFSTVLQALRLGVVEMIQRRVFVRIASGLVKRLLRVSSDAFDRQHGPELVNRFFETMTVQKSAALLLIDGLSIAMQTLVGMALLALYHPYLLVFDLFLLVALALLLFVPGRRAVATSIQESVAKYAVAAWLEEVARHLPTFKSGQGGEYAVQRTDLLLRRYLEERSQHFRILLRQVVGFLVLQAFASAVVLGGGGWLVMQRQLTLGQLVAAELIVTLVVSGLAKFGKHLETWYDLLAAMDKLGHLADLPVEKEGHELLPASAAPAALRLEEASYRYETSAPVLDGISWHVPARARVGLRGTTGAGKSTLLDLIYGTRGAQSGAIAIDEIDYRDLRLAPLRSQVALVRSTETFHGTIEENVRLGNESVTSTDVRHALIITGLWPEVMALPDGLRTELSTDGRPLSHGQAIRLAIARAIAARPRLLLLDECLDQVENVDEHARLLDALFDREAPWTLILASSRSELLRRCDRVDSLRDGRIETDAAVAVR